MLVKWKTSYHAKLSIRYSLQSINLIITKDGGTWLWRAGGPWSGDRYRASGKSKDFGIAQRDAIIAGQEIAERAERSIGQHVDGSRKESR